MPILMFAYGMNTNSSQMKRRCTAAISLGKAELLNYKFEFCGPANVRRSKGDVVVGVMWSITSKCLAQLDILEGYPNLYTRQLCRVKFNGKIVRAITYKMKQQTHCMLPAEYYVNIVIDGYTEHQIDCAQIKQALNL